MLAYLSMMQVHRQTYDRRANVGSNVHGSLSASGDRAQHSVEASINLDDGNK